MSSNAASEPAMRSHRFRFELGSRAGDVTRVEMPLSRPILPMQSRGMLLRVKISGTTHPIRGNAGQLVSWSPVFYGWLAGDLIVFWGERNMTNADIGL